MIDSEKGKWEKIILSLLWSLRGLNTSVSLPRKLDAASPCPELFRSCLNCRPFLYKMPMNQLPSVLAVLTPTSDIPRATDAPFALWQQGKFMVPSPTKCLFLALLMWRRWRSWNTAVNSWKGLRWVMDKGTWKLNKRSSRTRTIAQKSNLSSCWRACCHLFTGYCWSFGVTFCVYTTTNTSEMLPHPRGTRPLCLQSALPGHTHQWCWDEQSGCSLMTERSLSALWFLPLKLLVNICITILIFVPI